jgi:hypothetical protein
VLCGDEYVLKEFGRMGNTYAASALGKVKQIIADMPERAAEVLEKMKSHLQQGADRAVEGTTRNIHPNYTQKYTSINLKDNRIEFRSPGGDWLGEYRRDPGKLVNTMLRFVVALDAAMDPEKYRKEYLTKLYKLLNPKGQKDEYGEMVEQFARYVAGVGGAPEQVVKNFRRLATNALQQGRKSNANQYYEWQVYGNPNSSYQSQGITVVARDQAEAYDKASKEWKVTTGALYNPDYYRDNRWHAVKVRPVATPVDQASKFIVWNKIHNNQVDAEMLTGPEIVNAPDIETAQANLDAAMARLGVRSEHFELRPRAGTATTPTTPTIRDTPAFDQRQLHYEVFDRDDPEQDTIEVVHGTISEIAAMLEHMAARRNVPRTRLGIRPIGHTATGPEAGAEQPQQPRQATAPNGVPLWEIYERDSGHVVHTFADHSQPSAWSTAQQWLRTYAEPAAASGFSCRPKMETN